MSLTVGLVRYHILRDSDCCHQYESRCAEFLDTQYLDYYDSFNGARTQFIAAIILSITSGPVGWLAKRHPTKWLPIRFALLYALCTYLCILLFCDNVIRSFYGNPVLPSTCTYLSEKSVQAAHTCAWFSIILASVQFYIYVVWQHRQVIELGLNSPHINEVMMEAISRDNDETVHVQTWFFPNNTGPIAYKT